MLSRSNSLQYKNINTQSPAQFNSHPPAPSPPSPSHLLSIQQQLQSLYAPHFKLEFDSGEGAFSIVYKARYTCSQCYDYDDALTADCHCSFKLPVALKRISPLASPQRILDEIRFLRQCQGIQHVCQLLHIHYNHHSPTLIFPHFPHHSYKTFYRLMSIHHIQLYIYALLYTLCQLHERNIVHRDVKPGNWLCFYHKHAEQMKFALVDFGLAQCRQTDPRLVRRQSEERDQRENSDVSMQSESQSLITNRSSHKHHFSTPMKSRVSTHTGRKLNTGPFNPNSHPSHQPSTKQQRLPAACRAGTRGFRAPEILMRCQYQSEKIDIWSVGCILLSLLSGRYPFFHRSDDCEALVEILQFVPVNDTVRQRGLFSCVNSEGEEEFIRFECSRTCQPPDWAQFIHESTACQDEDEGVIWPKEAYELLEQLLQFDPDERICAREACEHRFFKVNYLSEEAMKQWWHWQQLVVDKRHNQMTQATQQQQTQPIHTEHKQNTQTFKQQYDEDEIITPLLNRPVNRSLTSSIQLLPFTATTTTTSTAATPVATASASVSTSPTNSPTITQQQQNYSFTFDSHPHPSPASRSAITTATCSSLSEIKGEIVEKQKEAEYSSMSAQFQSPPSKYHSAVQQQRQQQVQHHETMTTTTSTTQATCVTTFNSSFHPTSTCSSANSTTLTRTTTTNKSIQPAATHNTLTDLSNSIMTHSDTIREQTEVTTSATVNSKTANGESTAPSTQTQPVKRRKLSFTSSTSTAQHDSTSADLTLSERRRQRAAMKANQQRQHAVTNASTTVTAAAVQQCSC